MCSDYYSLGLKFKVLKLKYIPRIGFSTENVCFQMWRGDQNNTEDIAGIKDEPKSQELNIQ